MDFIKPLKIGDVEIKNNVFLAPLAGVTDVVFRSFARAYGAGLTYTEMISAKALSYNNEKTEDLARIDELEVPCAVQIFGNDPKIVSEMVNHRAIKKFDLIDINMGCPVKKIVNNGEGSALMLNLDLASKIIKSCAENTTKPITVKFRKGFDENSVNCVEFAQMCEDSGAKLITVHGRTRNQMYEGNADYSIIKKVKESVKIPVIANGDITSRESALRAFEVTGCDGIMVARGALGRPYIFSEILDIPFDADVKKLILIHIEKSIKTFGERYTVCVMRSHIGWYLKGRRDGKRIKEMCNHASTVSEMVEIINSEIK